LGTSRKANGRLTASKLIAHMNEAYGIFDFRSNSSSSKTPNLAGESASNDGCDRREAMGKFIDDDNRKGDPHL
jgi:hypothetical protein